MATLAELLLASRTGNLAGLFGTGPAPVGAQAPAQAVPQRRQGTGGVEGVLGTIFAGPDDPALSDPQNAAARRRGLIQAGLAALAGSSSPVGTPSLGQVIGGAAAVGQETAQAMRGQALLRVQEMENENDRIAIADALGGKPTRQSVAKAMQVAVERGAFDVLPSFVGLAQVLPDSGPAGEQIEEITVFDEDGNQRDIKVATSFGPDGSLQFRTPDVEVPNKPKEAPDPLRGAQKFERVNPVTGALETAVYFPATGQIKALGELPPDTNTTDAMKVAQARMFVDAFDQVQEFSGVDLSVADPAKLAEINGVRVPGLVGTAAQKFDATRGFVPEDENAILSAGETMAISIVFNFSGKAASNEERKAISRAMMPLTGDRPDNVVAKIRRLSFIRDAMQQVINGSMSRSEGRARVQGLLPELDTALSGALSDEAIRAGLRAGTNP